MQQVIINKDLIGEELLYHTEDWYHCKYFSLREEYCYIEDDSIVKEDFYGEIIDTSIPYDYSDEYNILFKFENNNPYAIFEYQFITYRIPYNFYKNIIERVYCDVLAIDKCSILNSAKNSKLMFFDNGEIVGWLENCAFDILKNDTYKESKTKNITQNIKDNIIFKDVTPFFKGISRVIYNDFCAKLDTNGNIIQKLACEDCWFCREYTVIKINGKWGAIDLSNNIIIFPQYDDLFYWGNDFWEVTINNKKGIIDALGNIILPMIYDRLYWIYDNYILAKNNNKYGVFNFNGEIIIPLKYDELEVSNIKRKELYFYATKNYTTGIIDINNNIIIPFIYKSLVYLSKNTIIAKIDERKVVLINEKNEHICSKIFEEIHNNYDETDIYPAKLNGLWGFIDEFGNKKIDFKYANAENFSKGYCQVSIRESPNNYGLINKKGILVLDYKYDSNCTHVINDDRFIVEQDGEPYIIDRSGNVIVDNIYTWISNINDNDFLLVTLDNDLQGFINIDGEPLKINKKTLDIPISPIHYDNLSQAEKISLLFKGEVL